MSGWIPGAMVVQLQLGSPDPCFFGSPRGESLLTLRSIPPSERQKKNVSLIQPGHHVCLMTFDPNAFYVPQKWLVIVTSHDFPGVQKCPRYVNPNMGKTVMLWSHLVQIELLFFTPACQMLPSQQMNIHVATHFLKGAGYPWSCRNNFNTNSKKGLEINFRVEIYVGLKIDMKNCA